MNQAAGILVYCKSTKRFLIAKRGPDINDPNVWATFGGKADEDESIKQTAYREFKEESGYDGNIEIIDKPMSVENSDGFVFTTYLGIVETEFEPPMVGQKTVDGVIETAKVRWVNIETLKQMIDNPITHHGFNNFLKKYIKGNNMKSNIKEATGLESIKKWGNWSLSKQTDNSNKVNYAVENIKTGFMTTLLYYNGKVVYDYPEQIPSNVKTAVLKWFQLSMSESTANKKKLLENKIRKMVREVLDESNTSYYEDELSRLKMPTDSTAYWSLKIYDGAGKSTKTLTITPELFPILQKVLKRYYPIYNKLKQQ